MNPNKALWEKGDFTRIAESMRESGEALVTKLGITRGLRSRSRMGDGTTAYRRRDRGRCAGRRYREKPGEPGTNAPKKRDSELHVSGGRCVRLHELKDDTFDLVGPLWPCLRLPFEVAKEMVR
jgi:hypothetical protein